MLASEAGVAYGLLTQRRSGHAKMISAIGTCLAFCPAEEVEQRMRLELVHTCERAGALVKRYARHGAGDAEQPTSALRPLHTLARCQRYLLDDVLTDASFPLPTSYEFIEDRLRAIRQDVVIQGFRHDESLAELLLEQVRFHSLAAYFFCGGPLVRDLLASSSSSAMSTVLADDHGSVSDGFDAVLNDSRLKDALGVLDFVCSSHANGDAEVLTPTALIAGLAEYRAELLLFRLATSLLDPAEVTHLIRSHASALRSSDDKDKDKTGFNGWRARVWEVLRALSADWLDGRWHGFLRGIQALTMIRGAEDDDHRARRTLFALRCLLHRFVPHARLQLLRQLNESVPARLGFQIAPDLARLLHFTTIAAVDDEDESEARNVGIFRAAQLCMQCKLQVKWWAPASSEVNAASASRSLLELVVGSSSAAAAARAQVEAGADVPVFVDAPMHLRLRSIYCRAASSTAEAPLPPLDLRVFFDKAVDLDPRTASLAIGSASSSSPSADAASSMGTRLLVALTPTREDELVGWPLDFDVLRDRGFRAGAALSAAIRSPNGLPEPRRAAQTSEIW